MGRARSRPEEGQNSGTEGITGVRGLSREANGAMLSIQIQHVA